jgi:hypothetical protein
MESKKIIIIIPNIYIINGTFSFLDNSSNLYIIFSYVNYNAIAV